MRHAIMQQNAMQRYARECGERRARALFVYAMLPLRHDIYDYFTRCLMMLIDA